MVYKIVANKKQDGLEAEVNALLQCGWSISGSVAVAHWVWQDNEVGEWWAQAMTRDHL